MSGGGRNGGDSVKWVGTGGGGLGTHWSEDEGGDWKRQLWAARWWEQRNEGGAVRVMVVTT